MAGGMRPRTVNQRDLVSRQLLQGGGPVVLCDAPQKCARHAALRQEGLELLQALASLGFRAVDVPEQARHGGDKRGEHCQAQQDGQDCHNLPRRLQICC